MMPSMKLFFLLVLKIQGFFESFYDQYPK